MSLILATGSNIGEKLHHLDTAIKKLQQHFNLIKSSRVYQSDPVEYLDQDIFYNQVLEFEKPKNMHPLEVFKTIKNIEDEMGRVKIINKGPRNIDIDIIFNGLQEYQDDQLSIPHHSWQKRSFVVLPLSELPFYQEIKKHYQIPQVFESKAFPI